MPQGSDIIDVGLNCVREENTERAMMSNQSFEFNYKDRSNQGDDKDYVHREKWLKTYIPTEFLVVPFGAGRNN